MLLLASLYPALLAVALGGWVHSSSMACWAISAAITPYAAPAFTQHSHHRLFLCPNPSPAATGCTLIASWAMAAVTRHLHERGTAHHDVVLHCKVTLISRVSAELVVPVCTSGTALEILLASESRSYFSIFTSTQQLSSVCAKVASDAIGYVATPCMVVS